MSTKYFTIPVFFDRKTVYHFIYGVTLATLLSMVFSSSKLLNIITWLLVILIEYVFHRLVFGFSIIPTTKEEMKSFPNAVVDLIFAYSGSIIGLYYLPIQSLFCIIAVVLSTYTIRKVNLYNKDFYLNNINIQGKRRESILHIITVILIQDIVLFITYNVFLYFVGYYLETILLISAIFSIFHIHTLFDYSDYDFTLFFIINSFSLCFINLYFIQYNNCFFLFYFYHLIIAFIIEIQMVVLNLESVQI